MTDMLLYLGLAAIVAGLAYYNGGPQSVANPVFWVWIAPIVYLILVFAYRNDIDTLIVMRCALALVIGWLLEVFVELVYDGIMAYREQKARDAAGFPKPQRTEAVEDDAPQEPVFYDFSGNEVTIWRRCFRHAPI